jgi:[histone H3]-lysine36 N-dimethyltransferase SETMAR
VSIKEERHGMLSHGVLLLHDNAPAHASVIAQDSLHEAGFEQLAHPAYSPGLAPSDFYLFPHLKAHLRGQRFENDNDVCHAAEAFFSHKRLLGLCLVCRCWNTVMKSALLLRMIML